MTLQHDQLEAFSLKFEEIVSGSIEARLLIPEIIIDTAIRFADINVSLYNILKQMEPFGPENMRPVFVARQVMDSGYSKIVKEQHIRFSLRQGNTLLYGIGFNMPEKFHLLQLKKPVDIVFTVDENEWNGQKNLQLKVIDFRLSEEPGRRQDMGVR